MLLLTAVLEDHMTMFLKLFFFLSKRKKKNKIMGKRNETKRKEDIHDCFVLSFGIHFFKFLFTFLLYTTPVDNFIKY